MHPSQGVLEVRQVKVESLRSYVDRFNMKVIQMDNLKHEIVYEAIKKGCRNTRLMESLIKNPAKDYY